jgi:pSer/pThr/pTyr-binding forkhead associated (FHA) protein
VLADGITPFALSAIKYGLFALLFLFIWRSMRWVVRGLNVDTGPSRAVRSGKAPPPVPAAPPGPSSVLIYGQGNKKPRSVKVAASMVMGRAPECELMLDDTYVSQQHARLFGKNGSWYVEDLGSTNGTFVNEQRLAAPAMVQPGDRIRVGQTVLELRR